MSKYKKTCFFCGIKTRGRDSEDCHKRYGNQKDRHDLGYFHVYKIGCAKQYAEFSFGQIHDDTTDQGQEYGECVRQLFRAVQFLKILFSVMMTE